MFHCIFPIPLYLSFYRFTLISGFIPLFFLFLIYLDLSRSTSLFYLLCCLSSSYWFSVSHLFSFSLHLLSFSFNPFLLSVFPIFSSFIFLLFQIVNNLFHSDKRKLILFHFHLIHFHYFLKQGSESLKLHKTNLPVSFTCSLCQASIKLFTKK